jgi:hypothetical protein
MGKDLTPSYVGEILGSRELGRDVVGSKKPELTEDDLLFLDTLNGCGFGHVSEANLKSRLQEHGMAESTYNTVKHKLLFARFIGSVYGNLTLEKKDYKPLETEIDKETGQ